MKNEGVNGVEAKSGHTHSLFLQTRKRRLHVKRARGVLPVGLYCLSAPLFFCDHEITLIWEFMCSWTPHGLFVLMSIYSLIQWGEIASAVCLPFSVSSQFLETDYEVIILFPKCFMSIFLWCLLYTWVIFQMFQRQKYCVRAHCNLLKFLEEVEVWNGNCPLSINSVVHFVTLWLQELGQSNVCLLPLLYRPIWSDSIGPEASSHIFMICLWHLERELHNKYC